MYTSRILVHVHAVPIFLPSGDYEGTASCGGVCVPYSDVSIQTGTHQPTLSHTQTLNVLKQQQQQQ